MPRFTTLILLVTLCGGLLAPAHAMPLAAGDRHLVFAHYMVCFGNTLEFYKEEIALAQRHGIDGFALNCGDWLQVDAKTGATKDGAYVKSAERMYQAAKELNSGFKLFFSADVNNLRNLPVNIGDMVTRFAAHPNQFRVGEKIVISGWGGSAATYAEALRAINTKGTATCFVPFLYSKKYAMAWSPETVARFFDGQAHMDGLYHFAADGTTAEMVMQNATGCRVAHSLDKIFMAGACPAMNSPNLRDFQGLKGYGAMWEGLIRDDADWVELVTWNDYNEDTNLMPFRWPGGMEREYFNRDEAFLDATAYYSAWYKSGRQPAIVQDKLYVSYRNRSHWQRTAWSEKEQAWVDLTVCKFPYDQIHDDVSDSIYLTTFLTAPAELTVRLGKGVYTFAQPAGIGHAAVPLAPGVPQVVLARGGRKAAPLLQLTGRKLIIDTPTKANSQVGYHLANRTWLSGAAVGPVTRLEAEAGALTAEAVVETIGGRQAVRNVEKDGSGVTWPLAGLATATYNLRVTYSNPTAIEARLSMLADGPSRGENAYPANIPLFLPPTATGQFATVSHFWSLYTTTTRLSIHWKPGLTWGKANPAGNDSGRVLIDAVELVKVEPVTRPTAGRTTHPELVAIPGGTFVMGSAAGNPDERPAHPVTLSPFAIGKYEVTNEEFERFDPAHRQLRDGYSWRPREPVIYVSWTEAARYCNWLSADHGLTPVYAEKTWVADLAADGFRLPTEAEWEYVASGRGEGRRYPWGSAAPDATRGHCSGPAALVATAQVPSTPAGGVMPVGTFPAGASRDGVQDLAGNVAEWCTDWLNPYPADAQTDPCQQTPSPYRTIRGGSWGYYGHSQRCADREFNNGGYGGYIYIGFRVAINAAGWTKLHQ
jgi:glucan endo-1,3-alpha-glucosidase